MDKSWLCVQERSQRCYIVSGRRNVDRVISLRWLDTAATSARAFQQLSHVLVIPITGKGKELFAAIRTRIEQDVYRIEVSFAHSEVERLPVSG